MKSTYEKLYSQALAFSKAALNDQLSVLAIHKQANEIHGIVQAGNAKKLQKQNFEELEISKDMEVFDELERRFMKQYGELKENDLVEIMMAGVHQDFSGKSKSLKKS